MSTCRSCAAPVLWCVTDAGKRMPVDPEPAPEGNVWVYDATGRDPRVAVLAGAALERARTEGTELHLSHFVTCPQGRSWRRDR